MGLKLSRLEPLSLAKQEVRLVPLLALGVAACSGIGVALAFHERWAHVGAKSGAKSGAGASVSDIVRCSWERLITDVSERKRLCDSMARLGYAVVRVPQSQQRTIETVQTLTSQFFDMPVDSKEKLGKFRYSRGKIVGYKKRDDGAQFLEVHATLNGRVIPEPEDLPSFGPAAAALHDMLLNMGRTLLSWLAEHIGVPLHSLLQCLDEPSLENLEPEDYGACVLRLCNYALCDDEVVFEEHTDASFLTLAPRSSTPGLQMWHGPSKSWLDIEQELDPCDVVVFVGDFIEVLTKGSFIAALHRVVLRSEDARHRISLPFLMRGQPSAVIDTVEFVEAAPEAPLLRIDKLSYDDLRKFLDMKGRMRARMRAKAAASGKGIDDRVLAPSA